MSLIQSDEILGLPWSGDNGFLPWMKARWKQGEHLNVAGPTGAGKTTFCTGLLEECRQWVLALDAKGGDKTLAQTGWPRISGGKNRWGLWLPNEHRKKLRDGDPVRLIIGNRAKDFAGLHKNWERQSKILEQVFVDGKWTLYMPDLQLLTDPGMGAIRADLNMMWIAARDKDVSLMTDMQEFSWTPKLARSMPRWFVAGYTRNTDSVQQMAIAAGRTNAEVRGMVQALRQREFSWLIFSNNPRDPVVVTVPDERKSVPTPGR